MRMRSVFSLIFLLVLSQAVFAAPAQILFIRHAEKINDADPNLSARGHERARRLVKLLTTDKRFSSHGNPVAIYAAAPKQKGSSLRPIQTLEPLAKHLDLEVISDFTKKEADDMIREIMNNKDYEDQTVVVSWVRQELPELVSGFGAKKVPKKWNDEVFDRVWKVEFVHGQAGKVIDLPQHLMTGDSKK